MSEAVTSSQILLPQDLQRLEKLRLKPRRKFAGRMRGERLSRQKGISLEFADYREYAVGDDLRHLDWNILARLGRPTIRTYQDEDDLAVYVLLDASASMDFGRPTKFGAAKVIAAAVGFIGLCGQDRVTTIVLGSPPSRSLVGRAGFAALSRWASSITVGTSSSFAEGVDKFIRLRNLRRGFVVIVSDCLDPDAVSTLRKLAARGHELLMVQVLSPFDLNPAIEGDLRLVDSELGTFLDITADSDVLSAYKHNLYAHNKEIAAAVNGLGGRYLLVKSDDDVVDAVSTGLRKIGAID